MICTVANSLWAAGCIPESARFNRSVRRVAEVQETLLRRMISENRETEFGVAHGFSSIRSVDDFRRRVPLRDYDRHQPWINRAADGIPNVLTREAVRLFEPTSGSSGATKLIPYTRALAADFQKGIHAWIADLFTHSPQLLGGPAYWSISPAGVIKSRTTGGIPIGFDDDTSYLGSWRKRLVQSAMAVPGSVRLEADPDAFRYSTLLHLLYSRDLRLISVWSPTFLTLLLERLSEWSDRLVHDLEHGNHGAADHRRSREVRNALKANSPQEMYAQLWPKLALISCWKDATSSGPAASLAALFPRIRMQGKGLIATEAFISFPLTGHEDAALSIRSHFFEFLPEGCFETVLAQQLENGARYSVVVTTGGGLYRYMLGDQIQVTGHIHNCPMVRFTGREGAVSDWFGEKLNDAHVSRVFEETFRRLAIVPAFAMLACEIPSPTAHTPCYALYIDSEAAWNQIVRAAEEIEAALRDNFHYDYARRIGQLGPVRAVRIANGARTYSEHCVRNGKKMGDVKIPALDKSCHWSEVFLQKNDQPGKGKFPVTVN